MESSNQITRLPFQKIYLSNNYDLRISPLMKLALFSSINSAKIDDNRMLFGTSFFLFHPKEMLSHLSAGRLLLSPSLSLSMSLQRANWIDDHWRDTETFQGERVELPSKEIKEKSILFAFFWSYSHTLNLFKYLEIN